MLYIIKDSYFLSEYILDAIKDKEGIRIIQHERITPHGIKKIKHLIKRFVRAFIYNEKGLWISDFFSQSFLAEIKKISQNDQVLFWGCENLKELLTLNKEISCHTKNVFLWNPVSSINRNAYSRWEYAHYLHRSGMQVFTFDEGDAVRYAFHHINQVYRKPSIKPSENSEVHNFDVFYIGVDKHRTEMLKMLKGQFEKEQISYNFIIKKDKHSVVSPELSACYVENIIPYKKVLSMIGQSKCILEILQKKQTGMTLRTLEAVFEGKKLITNNKNIINSPIYLPNNVYIIGKQEQRTIREFLQTPICPIPPSIINSYNIEYWIKQFMIN